MNCENCSTVMLFEEEGAYYHCPTCGELQFFDPIEDEPHPEEESKLIDRELECPVCEEQLTPAALQLLQVHHCEGCRGILLRHQDFGILAHELRRKATGPPTIPKPLDPSELEREIACPVCFHLLNTHPYYGPGSIVIDSCGNCGVVWLDGGELETVINAPGKGRGA